MSTNATENAAAASPARARQTTELLANTAKKEGQTTEPPVNVTKNEPAKPPGTSQDHAVVSGKVEVAKPKKLKSTAVLTLLEQREVLKQNELDALQAHQTTAQKLSEAKESVAKIERQIRFEAGMKVIHRELLRASEEARQSILDTFLSVVDDPKKQVLMDYLAALREINPSK